MLELPWPSADLSPNARVHWSKKAKAAKAYRKTCWAIACGMKIEKSARYALVLEFIRPTRQSHDDDNLIARFKSGRDGIAEALGIDDKRFVTKMTVSDKTWKGGKILCQVVPLVAEPVSTA